MKEVKALAVMTRPELEQALADVNVTRRLQHKLLELQQEQVRLLKAALDKIAVWGDDHANDRLATYGVYSSFDEPYSVEIARTALAQMEPHP